MIQLEKLTNVAQTQPHASYSTLTHGFFNKIVYLCRTTPGVHKYIHQLEDCLRMKLIRVLNGRNAVNDSVRSLLSLPAHLGDLGLINPIREAEIQYNDSVLILSPFLESIVTRNQTSIFTLLSESLIQKSKVKSNHLAHVLRLVRVFL